MLIALAPRKGGTPSFILFAPCFWHGPCLSPFSALGNLGQFPRPLGDPRICPSPPWAFSPSWTHHVPDPRARPLLGCPRTLGSRFSLCSTLRPGCSEQRSHSQPSTAWNLRSFYLCVLRTSHVAAPWSRSGQSCIPWRWKRRFLSSVIPPLGHFAPNPTGRWNPRNATDRGRQTVSFSGAWL